MYISLYYVVFGFDCGLGFVKYRLRPQGFRRKK
jgi:hypothetical protein